MKAKILRLKIDSEEVDALCAVSYEGIDPIELEGMMHLLNMSMLSLYMRNEYEAALRKCSQAEEIARLLGLVETVNTLASEREVIQGKLGIISAKAIKESGNTFVNQFQLITRWRTLMVAGEFDQAASLSLEPALSKLA